MAIKIYKVGNTVAHENTGVSSRVHLQVDHVYYWPLGTVYYKRNKTDKTFSIYRTNQSGEIAIATDIPASGILNEAGIQIGSDSETIDYLNGVIELFPNQPTLINMGEYNVVMTSDQDATSLLGDMLDQLKLINGHLSIMTESNIEL